MTTKQGAKPAPVRPPEAKEQIEDKTKQKSVPQSLGFSATQPKRTRYLNMLVYGPTGVGKTTFISTAQEVESMQDMILLDIESGDLSISDTDLDIITIDSYAKFARVYEWAKRYCKARDAGKKEAMIKLEAQIKAGTEGYGDDADSWSEAYQVAYDKVRKAPRCYRTIGLDSLTEIQKLCMYQLLGVDVGDYPLDMEPTQPQFKEWGQSAEMIRLLIRSFRNLRMNALFVALDQENEDETKRKLYKPALPGKLADEINAFFDVVGFMRSSAPKEGADGLVKAGKRRMFLNPSDTYKAKDRYHKRNSVDKIDNPTVAKFLEADED